MRQAITVVLSPIVLALTLGIGLCKDPPKDKAPPKDKEPATDKVPDAPDRKKSSYERFSGRTLNEWVRLLKSPDPSIRFDAINAVQFYGADSADAIPALLYILGNDPESTLRSNAAVVLMNVEVPNGKVSDIIDALSFQLEKNSQVNVRYHCVVTLGRFEDEAQKALPLLIKTIADQRSWEVRQAACFTLARVYCEPKKLAPDSRAYTTLLNALRDPASKVRNEALQGLLMFGSPRGNLQLTRNMTQALLALVNTEREHNIVVWAYFGLMLNDGVKDVYLNALVKLLQTGDVATRVQCLRALGMLICGAGTDATRKKMPEIIAALRDDDPNVVWEACTTLESISQKRELSDAAIGAIKAVADDAKREQPLRFYSRSVHERLTKKPDKTKKPETIVMPDKGEKR